MEMLFVVESFLMVFFGRALVESSVSENKTTGDYVPSWQFGL